MLGCCEEGQDRGREDGFAISGKEWTAVRDACQGGRFGGCGRIVGAWLGGSI